MGGGARKLEYNVSINSYVWVLGGYLAERAGKQW